MTSVIEPITGGDTDITSGDSNIDQVWNDTYFDTVTGFGSIESDNKQSSWPSQLRQRRLAKGLEWYVVVWFFVIHIGLLAAPFTFTWQALLLTLFLHWLTGGIGICLGYHRLLTHGSFQTVAPIRWGLAFLGGLSGEGSAVEWVANHRKHHAHSDDEGDPHSPHDGSWWSHVLWICWAMNAEEHKQRVERWAPDLARDRVLVWLDKMFLASNIFVGLSLSGVGYWMGGFPMAISFLVWGSFVRMAFVMHSTWFVNSASHMWGYRNYETSDKSRNNWWVALLTYGEGWHNNHHAYPRMAKHGHRWWEMDATFLMIRFLQAIGLAWNVVDYKQRHVK